MALLAGCASLPDADPVAWWHGLEGGRIARQRPPPPGVTDPYPNLAQVPERPAIPDAAARQRLSAQLAVERDVVAEQDAADPLPNTPATVAPRPPPAAAQPSADAATATLDAAAGPPAPPALAAAPAAKPGASAQGLGRGMGRGTGEGMGQGGAATSPAPPGTTVADVSAPLPTLPDRPPPLPSLPGVVMSAPAAPSAPPAPSRDVAIGFPAGSDALPISAVPALRELAGRRAGKALQVVGRGEAGTGGPAVQGAALALGLRRARAIEQVLVAAGVPQSALRLDAEAAGRGAQVRLLD